MVFEPASAGLAILDYTELGRAMVVGGSLEDGLIRAGADLPFEMVVAEPAGSELNWQDLMLFRRISDLLPKPLLVRLLVDIKTTTLETLWEAGVDAVIVPAGPVLKTMRANIAAACFSERRKWMKMRPLVPLLREASSPLAHEEDDEDDGEDE